MGLVWFMSWWHISSWGSWCFVILFLWNNTWPFRSGFSKKRKKKKKKVFQLSFEFESKIKWGKTIKYRLTLIPYLNNCLIYPHMMMIVFLSGFDIPFILVHSSLEWFTFCFACFPSYNITYTYNNLHFYIQYMI